MDVLVNQFNSQMQITDSEAFLNPQVLDRLTPLIAARLKEHMQHEKTVQDEQRMRPSMTSREVSVWE